MASPPNPSAPLCLCGVRGCWLARYHAALLGTKKRRR